MARTNNLTNFLTDVADSIREKTGKSDPIACEDFDTEIESISGGSSARLPSEYQEVEYISGTGTQYINTLYKPNQDTKTEISVETINLNGTFVPFGTRENARLDYVLGINFNSKNYIQYNTNTAIYSEGSSSSLLNTKFIARLDKNIGRITYNDTNIDIVPTTTSDFSCNTNLYLGCLNNNGNTQYLSPSYKLYYCKIWEDGTLIKYLIPCYRKSDDEIGLYDLVNNVFLINAGTGTFVKGNNHDTPLLNLQYKTMTIISNKITNITADTGYDGLSEVEIITDVPTGGDTPSVGTIFSDWDSSGYPHTARYGGKNTLGSYYFATQSNGTYGITSKLENVILSDEVTQINNYAFNYCTSLVGVVAKNVSTIGQGAFYYNNKLASLPSCSSNGVTFGANAFQGCALLNISTIPSNVTSIGNSCFQSCTAITISEIPTTVTNVGNSAFYGCTGITSLTLHSTTTLGGSVFCGCTGLVTVTLDGSTFNLPSNVFQQCTNLSTIDTTKLTIVPQFGFDNCRNLSVSQFHNTTDFGVYGANIFRGCKKIYQLSFPLLKGILPNAQQYATFSGCNIKAIWLGSSIATNGLNQYSFRSATELRRIFFDLPRVTVEAMPQYANKFSGNTVHSTCEIICNDDSGWLTLAQFDAIDWEHYSF